MARAAKKVSGPEAEAASHTASKAEPAPKKAAKAAAPPSLAKGTKAAGKAGSPSPAKTAKKAAPPPPAKPARVPVVTLKHLAAGISERRGMPKRDAEALAAELISDMLARVKEGARVKVAGLGILEIKDRPARTARNPATGEPVQVKASRKVTFRPAKELKEAV